MANGAQAASLNFSQWSIFDEKGKDCEAVLTWDTTRAPMTFEIGHRREANSIELDLAPENVVHADQVKQQFEATKKDFLGDMKNKNAKITSIQEILDRKAERDGHTVPKRTAAWYRRFGPS